MNDVSLADELKPIIVEAMLANHKRVYKEDVIAAANKLVDDTLIPIIDKYKKVPVVVQVKKNA